MSLDAVTAAAAAQMALGKPSVVLETLNVTANGEYDAPAGVAYDRVEVSVANSYNAGDDGKVVQFEDERLELVSQTARAAEITENGTYDTTYNNEVTVNVAGGGVEVGFISGTLAAPFGAYAPANILAVLNGGMASAIITIDASALGMGTQIVTASMGVTGSSVIRFSGVVYQSSSAWQALAVYYDSTGALTTCVMIQNGTVTDMSAYAAQLPTSLMLILHPLPE